MKPRWWFILSATRPGKSVIIFWHRLMGDWAHVSEFPLIMLCSIEALKKVSFMECTGLLGF